MTPTNHEGGLNGDAARWEEEETRGNRGLYKPCLSVADRRFGCCVVRCRRSNRYKVSGADSRLVAGLQEIVRAEESPLLCARCIA